MLSRKTILPVTGIILCLLFLVPGISAYAEKLNLGSQEIIVNLTWPEPDDAYYCNIPPCFMEVTGQVYGSGIDIVTVTAGNTTWDCGHTNGENVYVYCRIQQTIPADHIVLTVRGDRGTTTSVRRNVFSYAMPGPESIWVNGYVLDTFGNPIDNATLDFQTFFNDTNVSARARTDINGWYSMKRTQGFHQNITVSREGYRSSSGSATFRYWSGERMNFTLADAVAAPLHPAEPEPADTTLTAIENICSNWHLWCSHPQEKTQDMNSFGTNGPSAPSPKILQENSTENTTENAAAESPDLSPAVVRPGNVVSIDLVMGNNRNNISIRSRITILAGETTNNFSIMPGRSDQSPDSKIFALFSNQYTAISTGVVGMKPGEQKNISVHFKDPQEIKTWSREYLKKYHIDASNLSAGNLYVGTYTVPGNTVPTSTILGTVVSATREYAQIDFSCPDIQITLLQIKNSSTNTTPATIITNKTPVIQKISPVSGPVSGGTLVTITGTNLSSIHTINFGISRKNSFRNGSDTTIYAITPPSEPGIAKLYFQAWEWMGTYDGFRYIRPPATVTTTEAVSDGCLTSACNVTRTYIPARIPADGTKLVFNESDNLKAYTIPIDTEFSVNLTESLATNDPWRIEPSYGLQMLDSQYYANPKMPRPDIDGTHVWRFRAGQPGFQSVFAQTGWYGDSPRGVYSVALRVIHQPMDSNTTTDLAIV